MHLSCYKVRMHFRNPQDFCKVLIRFQKLRLEPRPREKSIGSTYAHLKQPFESGISSTACPQFRNLPPRYL